MSNIFRGIASLLSIKTKFRRPYNSQLARKPCSSRSGSHQNILRAKNPSHPSRCHRVAIMSHLARAHKESEAATGHIHARCSVGSFREWMGNPSWGREMASSREQRTSGNGVPHAAFPSSVQASSFFFFFSF